MNEDSASDVPTPLSREQITDIRDEADQRRRSIWTNKAAAREAEQTILLCDMALRALSREEPGEEER